MRLWTLIVVFAARAALADYVPCSPVFLANPQGRPLANTSVSIANLDGTPPVNPVHVESGAVFNNVMPANQLLQVFMDPAGEYLVHISGEGITKDYETICGVGIGPAGKISSISRSAELLLNTQPNAATLLCPTDGKPCMQLFQQGIDSPVTFDFVAPTFSVIMQSFLVTWFADDIPQGTSVWTLDWCTFAEGGLACSPSGANAVDVTSVAPAGHRRVDMLVLPTTWPLAWQPSDHVVIQIKRHGTSAQDSLGTVGIENVRMEMVR